MTVQIAVRLPEELIAQLDALVPDAHASRSQAVRRAIEVYLSWLANERDAAIYDRLPLSDAELAFADSSDAWADTPAW
ncbi:MAG TPA: ribbon-helix-helix domain-containing protein [Acidimicrobiia bacterium]|nr:ribbon-helix-helix domain-containing protein [Acidimicrobiia bacterium]